ncbi:hypothetical protein N7492_000731 [Penicillium capsulatum]|uniref:LYR motif-containing protein Cup1-like N-terminal domain-containing protein n=1 Tax=Penicillium capsulatum TaxID=69766 RepID=A0A9W9LZ87_9EURO|nr:hypothetical protein N7492_000731 [Penicillium capsulatum]KAJ6130210.1 hypothetical protein N7512_002990 [Penicillium capsulatum]
MASSRISHHQNRSQWLHLLRATLRECTYLPDPVARSYMRGHVLDRYRRNRQTTKPSATLARTAKSGLSILQRANEGYPKPFYRVMLMSYGRVGKRRHELLAEMMGPAVPNDANAVRQLLNDPIEMEDGWKPPEIVTRLLKSQANNAAVMSSRIRLQVKTTHPVIPEQNSWGRPLSRARRVNIRQRWYSEALNSLFPPLPDYELQTLDGLISGSIPWTPIPRRRRVDTELPEDLDMTNFLEKGPQKGHTFRKYVNGRPHKFTARFMHRTWKQISSLVPRMHWNDISGKWNFSWGVSKTVPPLSFHPVEGADLDHLFGAEAETQSTK